MQALVDTHTHLIHRAALGYSWTESIPALAKGDFTAADYFAIAADLVSDALYMEMAVDGDQGYKDEARLVSRMMHTGDEQLSGVVASCRPEDERGFEAWLEECVGMGVSGFRRVLHDMPDALSQSETYRANIRAIGRRGLPYDLSYNAGQLGIARELAIACPDTTLVLNHCGVPRIANGEFEPWRAGITALAQCTNVYCKLSGVTAYCGPEQDATKAVMPYIDHCLDAFGPSRVVWGSDWPVVNLGTGLAGWLDITRSVLDRLSEHEAGLIASKNAGEIYRLA